jgi:hypothetical protein
MLILGGNNASCTETKTHGNQLDASELAFGAWFQMLFCQRTLANVRERKKIE